MLKTIENLYFNVSPHHFIHQILVLNIFMTSRHLNTFSEKNFTCFKSIQRKSLSFFFQALQVLREIFGLIWTKLDLKYFFNSNISSTRLNLNSLFKMFYQFYMKIMSEPLYMNTCRRFVLNFF